MYYRSWSAVFGPACATLIVLGAAAHPSIVRAEGLRFSVGVMAGVSQSPFETTDPEAVVFPDFLIEGDRFSFGTSGLTVDAFQSGPMTLSARLAPRWVTADPADVPGLEGLKRKTAVEAGLAARFTFGSLTAEVEALKDVSSTHDGMGVSVGLSTGADLTDRLSIGVRAGVLWMDENLATYSYGVRASEAGGGLAAYTVKASIIPSIGVQASIKVSTQVSLIGGVQAEFLPTTVTRSPIVLRDTLVSAMVGVRYAF